MDIQVTKSAAKEVKKLIKEMKLGGMGMHVRVTVRECEGELYWESKFHTQCRPNDSIFESEGVSVVVSNDSLQLAPSIKIDFVKNKGGDEWFASLNSGTPVAITPGKGPTCLVKIYTYRSTDEDQS